MFYKQLFLGAKNASNHCLIAIRTCRVGINLALRRSECNNLTLGESVIQLNKIHRSALVK